MATSAVNKSMDEVWGILYVLLSQIPSWLNWSQMLSDHLTHHSMIGVLIIVSKKRRKISPMMCLNVLTAAILT